MKEAISHRLTRLLCVKSLVTLLLEHLQKLRLYMDMTACF